MQAQNASEAGPRWEAAGWGGGGFYWSAVYHPTRANVLYMGGDVAGVYKSTDGGDNWRLSNRGLVNYEVYSLAVDRKNPAHLYAATAGGLCKSTDEGESWNLLPRTGPKELRLTGERNKSIRSISVDGGVIFAASPAGKVYKSTDGGQSWKLSYETALKGDARDTRAVQFGKVNSAFFGGWWTMLKPPAGATSHDIAGFTFNFKGDGTSPNNFFLTLTLRNGQKFRSRNLNEEFLNLARRDIALTAADFSLEGQTAKAAPDAQPAPAIDWAQVQRLDVACSGALPTAASVARFGKFAFALKAATADAAPPALDFFTATGIQTYGNINLVSAKPGTIYSVAQSPADASWVIACTQDEGLISTHDGGTTWTPLATPPHATSVSFSPLNPRLLFATFRGQGIHKSDDAGQTWRESLAVTPETKLTEVVASPADVNRVFAIGAKDWSGTFFTSSNGGTDWTRINKIKADAEHNPTRDGNLGADSKLSIPTNLALNPSRPNEMYISANWRSCRSQDGGSTWEERNHGADISVITDIRFAGGKTLVTAMDEGSFISDDAGQKWRQLWPLTWTPDFSGHNWRIAANEINGKLRIISTCTPWEQAHSPRTVLSEDGGQSFQVIRQGLPEKILRANTMWGQGHPRALAVDPANPQILYLGIDGDVQPGDSGGGIFKSADGGRSWAQLPNQPACRRVFYALAVDPTDSKRLFWGGCGAGGGLYRSPDGGQSWEHVFKDEDWVFNMMVTSDGTVYAAGRNLWRSTDHGSTWKKITSFNDGRTIIGLEADPANLQRLWLSTTTWNAAAEGAVYESTNGGAQWNVINGDIPYVKPGILRYDATTRYLWAGGVGLFKTKR